MFLDPSAAGEAGTLLTQGLIEEAVLDLPEANVTLRVEVAS